ncbi:hypothetical protein [Streptomyces coeruleorubidus]
MLAGALATLVDSRGRILVEGLRPPALPEPVAAALADLTVGGGDGDPEVDTDWGEPGLSPAERVFGWNTLEVLTLPTVWIPHSHPSCSQHAPDEYLLGSVARERLRIMAGLFWDLGEHPPDADR